jgi:hypothetical protein
MTSEPRAGARRAQAIICGVLLAICGIVLLVRMNTSQPQLDADPEVSKTVDALFTALTSRDRSRLEDCEQRLNTYREAEQLAPAAAAVLDRVIEQAHAGDWEPAARRLYDFMLAQRGD